MSRVFFDELGVEEPDHYLDVRSGSHAGQVARVLERMEPVLRETEPDVVLVPGDVNSTLATALAAAQCHIPVAYVEAGLRSFDPTIPRRSTTGSPTRCRRCCSSTRRRRATT